MPWSLVAHEAPSGLSPRLGSAPREAALRSRAPVAAYAIAFRAGGTCRGSQTVSTSPPARMR